jgi:truncated hemoglobin YjbI
MLGSGRNCSVSLRKWSLFEKIGGEPALEVAVEIFCEKVISDPYLIDFFHGLNIDQFKAHQLVFMRTALSDNDCGSELLERVYESHSRLFSSGLNETHFDVVVDHLSQTLKELHVKPKYIKEIHSQVLLPFREIFVIGER